MCEFVGAFVYFACVNVYYFAFLGVAAFQFFHDIACGIGGGCSVEVADYCHAVAPQFVERGGGPEVVSECGCFVMPAVREVDPEEA